MTTREKAVMAHTVKSLKNATTFKKKIMHEREKYLLQIMKIPKPILTQKFKLKILREEEKYQLQILHFLKKKHRHSIVTRIAV
jgi:hypothetical protein